MPFRAEDFPHLSTQVGEKRVQIRLFVRKNQELPSSNEAFKTYRQSNQPICNRYSTGFQHNRSKTGHLEAKKQKVFHKNKKSRQQCFT